ncbi:hypothetical protein [Aequorivita flava]|uniref:STAS/SEC14 domain-containing protein n=1 Tax=Aequorivita flava TaxID=3114371 RepID=A0AB35YNG0_9FLAO
MIEEIRLFFGKAHVFPNYLVVYMNEGITVKPEYNTHLINIAQKYFKDRPFGYITNRINSYAVNPLVYLQTSKIENLVAFAIVSNPDIKKSNVELEKIFMKIPFEHFSELELAKKWVESIITKHSSN